MFLLTSTSDLVELVTAATCNLSVHASWVDNNAGTITPGRTNTPSITTATTTTIVGSPVASTQRNVQTLLIHNNSTTITSAISVLHTDGTNVATTYAGNLGPGETAQFIFGSGWKTLDVNGKEQVATVTPALTLVPFSSGTSVTVPSWNSYVPVTSTASGAKTVTLPTATGSLKTITIMDRGALAANPSNNITASGTTINGLAVMSVATQSLTFIDAAPGQIDSI